MTADGFAARLAAAAARAQSALLAAIPGPDDTGVAPAMRYAVAGGKGLRAFLVIEGAALHGVSGDAATGAAAAIEAIHAYSLIHDDLPAMDDDDLRRGKPTVHIAWDEATAILAGDALQALAFGLLADLDAPAGARLALVGGLAKAAGVAGMVGGQAMDIAAETADAPLSLDRITRLQALKTGALFHWAATAGPVLAGADPAPLAAYAQNLGLAFQIADDILDQTGDAARTGKRLGKDAAAGKATFVSLMGLDGARAHAERLIGDAKAALADYGPAAAPLCEAADFTLSRDR